MYHFAPIIFLSYHEYDVTTRITNTQFSYPTERCIRKSSEGEPVAVRSTESVSSDTLPFPPPWNLADAIISKTG
jgi:hypothetical protein